MVFLIESKNNKIVKYISSLYSKKWRDIHCSFVIEGEKFVKEINSSWIIELFCVSKRYYISGDLSTFEEIADVYVLEDELFEKVCETVNPQGILAVCKQRTEMNCKIYSFSKNPLFIVLEESSDPGNLGTAIRIADAVNADAVFVSTGSTDIYNPKVLRATAGSFFHLPVFDNVEMKELMNWFRENKVKTYAAYLDSAEYPYACDFTKASAIIIGNEARGLSVETANAADKRVKIPILGKAESLNASVACGVLAYEVVRQRMS